MGREEQELREWVRQAAHGEASRRQFIRTMLGLGLSGPLLADLLATTAPATAQDTPGVPPVFTPTRRGGGGKLRLLWWNAPTILNPHFATGGRDFEAARIVYEPLISVNPEGDFVPILAQEIPSVANGGRAPDGTWTTWRLKPGVVWHDGTPCTADDVLFTWEYATDPATATVSRSLYEPIRRIDKRNDHTITVVFKEPTPIWYASAGVMILPKHLFAAYTGANARQAPYNLKPVGTGPYTLVDFKPGDVALYEMNPHYHVPNRPFFDTVEGKGGGDATSAARAVIQNGEFDFAGDMQVDKDVMERLAHQGRKGTFHTAPGTQVEYIRLNRTDPWTEVEGERSSLKVPHPFFTDLRVRQALALAVDRRTIAEQLYGAAGQPTSNFLNSPKQFQSPHTRWEFNLDKAAQLLEQAGWKRGSDGIRVKGSRRMHSGPPAPGIDPQGVMRSFVSWEIAQKANNWAGRNAARWSNAEYDRLWRQAETELEPVKRAALFIRMNDLVIEDVVVIPVVWRNKVSAVSHSLRGMQLGPWDLDLWNLAYWYRETG